MGVCVAEAGREAETDAHERFLGPGEARHGVPVWVVAVAERDADACELAAADRLRRTPSRVNPNGRTKGELKEEVCRGGHCLSQMAGASNILNKQRLGQA